MHSPIEVLPHSPICALEFEKILRSNGKHYCNGGQLTKGSYSLLIYQMDTTILSRSDFIICFKVLYNEFCVTGSFKWNNYFELFSHENQSTKSLCISFMYS